MVSGLWIGWDVSGGKNSLVPCFQATMAYELQSKHEKKVYKKKVNASILLLRASWYCGVQQQNCCSLLGPVDTVLNDSTSYSVVNEIRMRKLFENDASVQRMFGNISVAYQSKMRSMFFFFFFF